MIESLWKSKPVTVCVVKGHTLSPTSKFIRRTNELHSHQLWRHCLQRVCLSVDFLEFGVSHETLHFDQQVSMSTLLSKTLQSSGFQIFKSCSTPTEENQFGAFENKDQTTVCSLSSLLWAQNTLWGFSTLWSGGFGTGEIRAVFIKTGPQSGWVNPFNPYTILSIFTMTHLTWQLLSAQRNSVHIGALAQSHRRTLKPNHPPLEWCAVCTVLWESITLWSD